MNSSALRTTLGTSTGLTSASVRPAVASMRAHRSCRCCASPNSPCVTRLPLMSAILNMPESLRTKNGVRSAWTAVMMRMSLNCAVERVLRLHDVGDADLDLAAADHRIDHLVAGGRLHQHVDAALLLEHLGDRGRGGVIERAGRQRGEAVGLRGGEAAVTGNASKGRGKRRSCRANDMGMSLLPPEGARPGLFWLDVVVGEVCPARRSLHSAKGIGEPWRARARLH